MRKERIYAIEACREIGNLLADKGFVTSKNGLSATRLIDKDLQQELYFDVTRHLNITVFFNIKSKKMGKWLKDKYSINNKIAYGLGNQLGYITPRKSYLSWTIGTSDIAKAQFIKESTELINTYLIPYFDQFSDMPQFIDKLGKSGGRISTYIGHWWVTPISFVLTYGGLDQAQILFDNYVAMNPSVRSKIVENRLNTDALKIGLGYVHAFHGSLEISIGFDNGVIMK